MSGAAGIESVIAWEALDSRGRPTVACEVTTRGGAQGTAVVPSGASTGTYEAYERRDEDPMRYRGSGVLEAVQAAETVLAQAVRGIDADARSAVDNALEAAAGGGDLGRVGANATLAVSLAAAIAGAAQQGLPLWRSLAPEGQATALPIPRFNIISGGAHAGGVIDVQDFLALPLTAGTFRQAVEWGAAVRTSARDLARARGFEADLVADEGGLGLPLSSNEEALALLTDAIETADLRPGVDVGIAVDVAATQLWQEGRYQLASEGRDLDTAAFITEQIRWVRDYPVVSIEDGCADEDWDGWARLTAALGSTIELVGDDLFATTASRVERGAAERAANAVLIKPNQAGTLDRAWTALAATYAAGFEPVVSARSGDTEDGWLADLAVGWGARQIKVGSTTRSERNAKWNRLLYLERVLDVPLADTPEWWRSDG